MKIILVEDSENSIANAMTQLGEHEIKVAKSILEFLDLLETIKAEPWLEPNWLPDAIITDVNIPQGISKGLNYCHKPETMAPAGLVVAIMATKFGIPCYILTDSNSHHDLVGFCLDEMLNHRNKLGPGYKDVESFDRKDERLKSLTRPKMLNGGKDYGGVSYWLKKISGTK